MTQTLLELAERLERASGPDRELDAEIAKALGETVIRDPGDDWFVLCMNGLGRRAVPAFTASLDAAMTLVPEGWFTFLAGEDRHSHSWSWHLRGGFGLNAKCRAATPALALTAAALQARALSRTQEGGS